MTEREVPPAADAGEAVAEMSFFDHLEELRRRIFISLAAIGVGFAVGFSVSARAFEFLARPMLDAFQAAGIPSDKLIYTSPLGALRLYITVALYLGIVLALPVVLHQVWMFVAPGLYRHERRATATFLFTAVALFLMGTVFGYYVLMPMTLQFLISFEGPFTPLISINEYFDLVLVILLGLGCIFQIPILIFFLSLFGIVTPGFLWNHFRYAILIIAILAAIITPTTDIVTMTVFMAPMIVLYLIGIGVSAVVVRRRNVPASREEAARRGGGPGMWIVWLFVGVVLAAGLVWAWFYFGWGSLLK